MTPENRHDDPETLRGDLAAYALDALPEREAAELEQHLEGCARCRELVKWLRPAVDVLPATAPQLSPPDSLRESLMTTVRAEAAATSPSRPGRSRPRGRSFWPTWAAPRPALAFGLAAVLAVGVAAGYAIRGEPGSGDGEVSVVEARVLNGDPQVSATLEKTGDSATLQVNALPALPRGKVYEVWIERAGVMEPSTLFAVDRSGAATVAVPGPLSGASRVLVTSEPHRGSPKPTSPPLLAAPL